MRIGTRPRINLFVFVRHGEEISMTDYETIQLYILFGQLVVLTAGMVIAFKELQKMSKTIKISARSNRITVVTSSAMRYQNLMREVPKVSAEERDAW